MNSKIELLKKNKQGSDKWVKLICGASNEDIVAIEDLCAIYTAAGVDYICLLYTSPSPRDLVLSRMPSSA